jgi:hypothetical protein
MRPLLSVERNRDAAFDRLAGNGAELVAFEWSRTVEHPYFREVLGLRVAR